MPIAKQIYSLDELRKRAVDALEGVELQPGRTVASIAHQVYQDQQPLIDLRDQMAIAVLPAIFTWADDSATQIQIAIDAYKMAEAMLEVRAKLL